MCMVFLRNSFIFLFLLIFNVCLEFAATKMYTEISILFNANGFDTN